MAEVIAQLNNLRLAPRKVRVVGQLIKGKKVAPALSQLEHMARRPAPVISKLLHSAVANAENNFNMAKDNLYIKSVLINEGRKLKRFRPKGFGRASEIQKKTSHIKLILSEVTPGLKRVRAQEQKTVKEYAFEKAKEEQIKKPEIKTEMGRKSLISGLGGLGRKLFRRKTIV